MLINGYSKFLLFQTNNKVPRTPLGKKFTAVFLSLAMAIVMFQTFCFEKQLCWFV